MTIILPPNDRPTPPAGKLSPDPSFVEALGSAVRKALKLRKALDEVMRLSPAGDAALWATTVTDPEVAEQLGALSLLCDGASAWTTESVGGTLALLSEIAPRPIVAAFEDSLANGKLRTLMSCTCGICGACQARANLGEKEAEIRLGAELRGHIQVKPASGLVDLGGQPMRKG